ncbi:MAG TPA: lysine--tRNA ligase [Candidatus Saccharimonadales bacterium]|nr:lysine--tRNA ligase [Candidatus Saccharimonadales bacterium]
MQWLNQIADELEQRHPDGEILIESGGSPSGTYHLGHMRELIICDAILLELQKRGRQAKHIYYTDNLDAFRKVPANVPADYEQYLGMPLCDVPAPDGESESYGEQFLAGLIEACQDLNVDVEFIRSHEKYRSGVMVPVIERCLERVPQIKQALETVSNRQLPDNWTPIQVMDRGRLKNRAFVSIDEQAKTITYKDADDTEQTVAYDKGEVKVDWRLDWPGRWWLLKVDVEPFGREHASAGGSYDTGVKIMQDVYEGDAPLPVPYDSVHMSGDTKKMSASKGTAISANEGLELMPAEVIRYFMLRGPLNRPAFFDPVNGVTQLIDEFAALLAKTDKSDYDQRLLFVCNRGSEEKTVSRVPFSLLVASYQAALKDADKTLEILSRSEYAELAIQDAQVIKAELKFIDAWLQKRAPEDVKFALAEQVNADDFSDEEKAFLAKLAEVIAEAPDDADGGWFHQAVYDLKDTVGLEPKAMFGTLYRALIGKTSGPRAGWFLSILPRDWLLSRLRLED